MTPRYPTERARLRAEREHERKLGIITGWIAVAFSIGGMLWLFLNN